MHLWHIFVISSFVSNSSGLLSCSYMLLLLTEVCFSYMCVFSDSSVVGDLGLYVLFEVSENWSCFLYLYVIILNCRVYQLLGESGTYYGVRFGKNIPWVTEFPFGYIKDPQYVGSILSLFACLSWVPFLYIFLWTLGYVFMIHVESTEDPATRAKLLSWFSKWIRPEKLWCLQIPTSPSVQLRWQYNYFSSFIQPYSCWI